MEYKAVGEHLKMDAHHLEVPHIERNGQELDGALRQREALRQSILKKPSPAASSLQVASDEPASQLLAHLLDESGAGTTTNAK